MPSPCRYTRATLRWVDRMIIGQAVCPYTHPVRKRPHALRVHVAAACDAETLHGELDEECERLRRGPAETSLVVLPPTLPLGEGLARDFPKFLSLGWECVAHIEQRQPTVQLALFHPHAVRSLYSAAGDEDDAADYAMRSPYPTLHLLRTADVAAIDPAHAASVPERNVRRLRELGVPWLQATLAEILLEDDA